MKDVTITLDRERRLLFDFNALIAMEEETGESVLAPGFWDSLQKKPKAKIVRGLLWVCLLDDDPAITPQQAGRLIKFSNISQVMEKIVEAFNEGAMTPEPGAETPLAVARAD